MSKCNKITILSEELVNDDSIKHYEDQTKLALLNEVKDNIFSDKYFIVRASISKSNLIDLDRADMYIKGEILIEELSTKNLKNIKFN